MVGDAKVSEAMKLSDDVCAQEPIHVPGSIQPHGLLVGLDQQSLCMITKSANLDSSLPPTPFGETPPWLPPRVVEACHDLRGEGRLERTVSAEIAGIGAVEVHCFVGAGVLFCEFETSSATLAHPPPDGAAFMVTEAIKKMDEAIDIAELSGIAAEAVRAISGFERVLVYRFDADGHGDVPGESKVSDWNQSFLGLRFPASDIPAQARELYRVTSDRWIPCRDYEPVPLMPDHDPMGQPFNLTFSYYRSVSPIHRMYQKNISVDGSMSVSILRGGVLWGLVIGHHRLPHRISTDAHHHVTAIVRALGIRLDAILSRESKSELERDTRAFSAMLRKLAAAEDFLLSLMEGEPNIIGLLPGCTGAAVVWDDCGVPKARTLGDRWRAWG